MEKAVRDSYGRTIEYMRISITDRCNLRCRYCMPDGAKWIPMSEILTYEEIERICREAVQIGITRFKITGGEPLVRKGCADLIRMIRQIPGTEEVTMTTNGVLLGENLEDLLAAGLDAVNISLDTLIPEKYQEITGADELERVRKSIFMAEKSEIRVKINTVLQKGVNDEEWKSLAELAKKNKLDVRFIELMPIGQGRAENGISGAWVLGKLKEAYGIEGEFYPLEGRFGNGPAVYYQLPGFQGKIGLISALHGKFCDRCNRIRMTSTGKLKACLCYADTISVFEAARHGSEEEIRKCLEQAIRGKPKMHHFEEQNLIVEGFDFRALPVGTRFHIGDVVLEMTQIGKECHSHCQIYKRMGDCIMPREGVFAEVVTGGHIKVGDEVVMEQVKSDRPFSAAVITLSDKGAAGEREDKSGPMIVEMLKDAGYDIKETILLPDEQKKLEKELIRLADQRQLNVIFTTGGTGFSERDRTPEATVNVCDRMANGIAEAIRNYSMTITKRAMFSRAVSGIRKKTLIINLPGSPKAVQEALEFLLPELGHGLGILRGTEGECARK